MDLDAFRHRHRSLLGEEQYVKTAVLVPLVQAADGEWAVLFERRALTLRRQAGEVCFPGGHCDPADVSERRTAIRETCEELGVPESQIEYIGELDVLMTWSRLMVYPFVGIIRHPEDIQPNPSEVAEAFTVPLAVLLATKPQVHVVTLQPQPSGDFPYHLVPGGQEYAWREAKVSQMFYELDGQVIWGMTARILSHFLDLVRTPLLVDANTDVQGHAPYHCTSI
jgi:peroxisomal coenzyme A diphosphatase NUDT7